MSEEDRLSWCLDAFYLYLGEKYDEAVKLMDEVLEEFPEEREARVFRAWCILRSRDYERAYHAFHDLRETEGDNTLMWSGLSYATWAMNDLPEALSCMEKAIASYPPGYRYVRFSAYMLGYTIVIREAELHHDNGVMLLEMHRLEESLDSFNDAIRLDAKHQDAWVKKGRVLMRLERYDEALEALREAAILDEYNPPLPSDYEAICEYEDDTPKPKTWQQMLDGSPEPILRDIGWCLDHLGRHEESLELYTRLTERYPDDAGAWFWKAYALSMTGRPDEAIACYERSIAIDPDPDAHMNIGYILKGMGKFDEAVEAYESALDLDSQMYDAWEHIGDCHAATGRHDEAVESYRNYLGDDGVAAWIRVKLADSLASAGRVEEAEHEYQGALESSIRLEEQYGGNPFTFQARADALTALGREQEAEEWRIEAARLREEHDQEGVTAVEEEKEKNRAVFVEVPKKINEMTEEEKEAFAIEVLNALTGQRKRPSK